MENKNSTFSQIEGKTDSNQRLVVVDANALVHRAYHALPVMTSPAGEVVQGVYGFFSTFFKMVAELDPDYIVSCFDLPKETFRHKKFAGYKAQRPETPEDLASQMPILKESLGVFGVPVLEQEGFEADDLIGSIAKKAEKEDDLEVIILTGDLDTLQLATKDTKVYTMRKGMSDTVIYDPKKVRERYGFAPEKLDDYRGLKGDPSDNIPGISGVGKKTASRILKRYKNIEELFSDLEDEEKRESLIEEGFLTERIAGKLLEEKEKAIFSKELATIRKDVDVDFSLKKARWPSYDSQKVRKKFYELGFKSLIDRLPGKNKGRQKKLIKDFSLKPGNFIDCLASYKKVFLLKKENEGLKLMTKKEKEVVKNTFSDFKSEQKKKLRETLGSPDFKVYGHDLKNCLHFLVDHGGGWEDIGLDFDTKLASYLLNPESSSYDLEKLRELYGPDEFDMVQTLQNRLEEKGQSELFYNIELPLIKVLFKVEKNGIKADKRKIEKLEEEVKQNLQETEDKIYSLTDERFNLNSPQQLSEVLFEKLDLPTKNIKKTKEGHISTAASELEKLKGEHEIIDLIFEHRKLEKLHSSYLKPLLELIPKEGRIHPSFNQTIAATGRLSCSEPNLQNVPLQGGKAKRLRDAFVASEGCLLASFDYSQVELRVAASLAEDENMIEAFREGKDIHTLTAARVFETPYNKVEKKLRNKAKALNFGIIYGISPYGFAQRAEVSRGEAKEFMEKYFQRFPAIKDYIERVKKEAYSQGYVETVYGRRRYLPELDSKNKRVQSRAERMAINHPIQGTAADIIKIAMNRLYNWQKENELSSKLKILLQIHDELIYEIKKQHLADLAPKIKERMEQASELEVPLEVDIKKGSRWGSLSEI